LTYLKKGDRKKYIDGKAKPFENRLFSGVTASTALVYSKIPKLQFPVDSQGRAFLVQDVTYYSRAALTIILTDGSLVTYSWYRFVDQPSFQQYDWSEEKKAKLQIIVGKIANWPIDRAYMASPSRGTPVSLEPALFVTPPKGMEVDYLPIVTHQSAQ
jgi:hypothetical protein